MSGPPADAPAVPDLDSLSLADQSRVSDAVDDFARRLATDSHAHVTPDLLAGFEGPAREVLLHHLLLEEFDRRIERAADQVAANIRDRHLDGPDRSAAETALAQRTAVTAPPPDADPARPRFRRYTLEGEDLGRGGTATVFAAFDARLRVRVAVKVLHRHLGDDAGVVRAFRQEGRRQVELRGSAVPTVFDIGHSECGRPFVAMEVVGGGGIRGRLPDPAGPFRFDPEVVRLVGRVCRAIAPIHARGFAHLDLSPGNVHLTPDGQVKVLDFGLAGEPGVAPADLDGGTPNFLAPEKARRQPHLYSPRTDVFSVGCLLVWAVTGRPLYPDTTDATELVRRVGAAELAEPLARLRRAVRRHRVPKELADLTAHCLAEHPDRRPPDAGEVADAIEGYFRSAEEERQKARVATTRRRGLLVVLGVLAAATAGGWFLTQWANREKEGRVTAEAEVRIRSGEAAAEAGRWGDARVEWRPLASEHTVGLTDARRFEVRLRLVRAASFLGDHAEVREELAALDAHPLAPPYRGRIDFERAIHHLGAANRHALAAPGNMTGDNPFDAAAYLLLCKVRDDSAVPPADRATARGLLARTADEAIGHYREALTVEPFHPYAGPYLLVTCLLAGRLADALARADAWAEATPQDPLPWFYKAFIHALRGESPSAALDRLARAAGGGRALPLSTVRACEGTVRAVQVINTRLPESATASDQWAGFRIGLATVKELAEVLPDGQDAALAALFAVPVPSATRRAFGRVLAAYESLASDPASGLALIDGADECVADGAVLFVRGLLLRRLGRTDEAADALLACAESDRQLWEVRAVCRLTLAAHALRRAGLATDPAVVADLRSQAKTHLRRAAERSGGTPAVVASVRQITGEMKDADFSNEVEGLLPPVGRR